MHDALIEGRGAWQRDDFASPEDWSWHIPPGVLTEFDRAVRRIRKEQGEIPRLALSDFPAPLFAAVAPRLRQELESGRGFVLIRGLPAGLPQGYPVEVTYTYETNNRLRIVGKLVDHDAAVTTQFERVNDLSDSEFAFWVERLAEGANQPRDVTDAAG